MSKYVLVAFATFLLALAPRAWAQNITDAQARAVIAPWYSLFNVATRGDVKSIHEQVFTVDYDHVPDIYPANAGVAMFRSRWSATFQTPFPT